MSTLGLAVGSVGVLLTPSIRITDKLGNPGEWLSKLAPVASPSAFLLDNAAISSTAQQ